MLEVCSTRRRQARVIVPAILVLLVVPSSGIVSQQSQAQGPTWTYYGGDHSFNRYSPLDQITEENVGDLRVAWRRPGVDRRISDSYPEALTPHNLRSTPIFVDGVLYAPNAVGLIEAFDAGTGSTVWVQAPSSPDEAKGESSRGVDYWRSGRDRRIIAVTGEYLYALNAVTGVPVRDFGEAGRVRLTPEGAGAFGWTSGPLVSRDVIVIAGNIDGAGDGGPSASFKEGIREDVRGYDVRSGELLWTFHVVPQQGEFGLDTWENDAWKYSGDMGSWCCLSADDELGLVYVPLTAPTTSWYGGHRPGDNLFSNSLVALDVSTGERVWHFQMVHHDLWEYDNIGPPVLGDITVDGRAIPAVMQASKTGFLYMFNRETGEPVWPIVERPVPPSNVPGEYASPTQPFPMKPAAFDRQGVEVDDLIDFTPELRARALEAVKPFALGPLFTPPVLASDQPSGKKATLTIPGAWGAGNWNTGAFDPESGIYYAVSHTLPFVAGLSRPTAADATMEYSWSSQASPPIPTVDGLPVVKPPYGRVTAIDMNTGEHLWQVANGSGPRDHPLLAGLDLPPLGVANRPAALVTRSLLFLAEGSDLLGGTDRDPQHTRFRAYDKATGDVVWEVDLGTGATGGPMSYLYNGRQYIVIATGSREAAPEWIALALP